MKSEQTHEATHRSGDADFAERPATRSEAEPGRTAPSGRLLSIDALRGFDMFWIIGGDALFHAIARWVKTPWTAWVATQLEHVEWEGFRFYDLIFPLFLFLVGVVLPFSLAKQENRKTAHLRILRRTLALVALGLVCNGILQFQWSDLRWAGVLQRIGICYGIGALIVLHAPRWMVWAVIPLIWTFYAAIFQVSWLPGQPANDYSKSGNIAGWVDRHYLPGKILEPYYGDGDNEGILSTIPAVTTVLLGACAGFVLRGVANPAGKVARLLGMGVAGLLLGGVLGMYIPVIKNLWTPSFVLIAGGWSLLLLGSFYGVIDVLGYRRWAFPFVVIGVNAITIYVVPNFVDFEQMSRFWFGGLAAHAGSAGAVILSGGVLVLEWLFLYALYRNRWYLRV
jgi:predicted acyltransferase